LKSAFSLLMMHELIIVILSNTQATSRYRIQSVLSEQLGYTP
jgi:hypothetical protein